TGLQLNEGGIAGIAADGAVRVLPQDTLRVISFQTTDSGFTAQFNRDFDLSELNLFHGQTSGNIPADITLTGRLQGTIAGSAVWESATHTLRFVRTGGALP